MEHAALDEGAVLVDLILDLTIGEVQVVLQQRDAIVIADRLSMHVVFVNLAATRVASRTHLDFALRIARHASMRVTSRWVGSPLAALAFVKRNRQSFVRGELFPIALLLCPLT